VRWFPYTEDLHPPLPQGKGPSSKLVNTVLSHALSRDVILCTGGDFVPPYERGIKEVAEWNRAHPRARLVYSTYLCALKRMEWAKAPRYAGEWNPDFAGTYSSRIRNKQANRASEALLMTAEALSVLARQRLDIPPDQEGLLRAWKLACVNQFHDICWGTIVDRAYSHALDRAKRVRIITQNIIESRLASILDSVPASDEKHRRLIAFNPLPWPRKADIEVRSDRRVVGMSSQRNVNEDPVQTLRVELPACGYRVLTVLASGADVLRERTPFTWARQDDGRSLRIGGPFYSATISASGVISSLVRSKDALEFVDPLRPWSNMLCGQTDHGDLWNIYNAPMSGEGEAISQRQFPRDPYPLAPKPRRYGYRTVGFPVDNRLAPARKVFVRENSADRLVIGVQGTLGINWPDSREFKGSSLKIGYDQAVTFYADTPRIDFCLRTRHERGCWYRLRVAFFTDIRNGTILHEIPFGRLRRPEGEFAAQNYMAYCGEKKGLALFNRGLPGNNVTDGVLMLSLMRSVAFPDAAEAESSLEAGEQHLFEYALLPFGGKKECDASALAREGMEFAVPPYVYETDPMRLSTRVEKSVAPQDQFLILAPESICCTAVYPLGNGVVIRLFESRGKATESVLQPNFPVASVRETNALLRNPRALKLRAGKLALSFKPFEIKTVVLR
jgi:alpha-mannosidase